jgi:hypothetical protein
MYYLKTYLVLCDKPAAIRWGARQGSKRKAHRPARHGRAEDLQRRARFPALRAGKAPEDRRIKIPVRFSRSSRAALLFIAGNCDRKKETRKNYMRDAARGEASCLQTLRTRRPLLFTPVP